MSTDSGSNYNVTKTSTFFRSYHFEDDTETGLGYIDSCDLAQSTAFQKLTENGFSNDADVSLGGYLTIFNPSSTTYVKHFISTTNNIKSTFCINSFIAGYGNTTSAVNAIQFKMDSGNFDGIIKLYGVKKS
jgi:hypothetical protein